MIDGANSRSVHDLAARGCVVTFVPQGGELPDEEVEAAADRTDGEPTAEGERVPAEAESAAGGGPPSEPS